MTFGEQNEWHASTLSPRSPYIMIRVGQQDGLEERRWQRAWKVGQYFDKVRYRSIHHSVHLTIGFILEFVCYQFNEIFTKSLLKFD